MNPIIDISKREMENICKDLRILGDNSLTKKALFAYAAMYDVESPRVDLSYSYIMRKLRAEGNDERRLKFQKVFKDSFDQALYNDLDNPENIALMNAVKAIDFKDEDA